MITTILIIVLCSMINQFINMYFIEKRFDKLERIIVLKKDEEDEDSRIE